MQRPPHPVDGMPREKRAKKVEAAAPDLEPLEDRISALPDGVLQHLLGFLPADDAVRTSVLARQWRHQWRFMRRVRIDCDMPRSTVKFVNNLLHLRAPGMDLDEFELSSEFIDLNPEFEEQVHTWSRHASMRKVRVLIINLAITLDRPLVFQHLRRLEIGCVHFRADCLDFTTCPMLEFLSIEATYLYCSRIVSHSVRHLRIINSSFHSDIRACISMPSLISLQLNPSHDKAPQLEFMPSLQTAFVKPASNWRWVDTCKEIGDSGDDCCGNCANCCGEDDHRGRCILLGGLSNAIDLELVAHRGTSIFRRDLRWCPTFSKLKTLLLNEWFVAIDLSGLVCILEHSPVLEKLTVQISQDTKCKPELEGRNHQMERVPQVSEHLKTVEIKCENVGFWVFEILRFLSTFVAPVIVIRASRKSTSFSSEGARDSGIGMFGGPIVNDLTIPSYRAGPTVNGLTIPSYLEGPSL